jgi:PAT family beta-lactamase induction signal transducer AmpG
VLSQLAASGQPPSLATVALLVSIEKFGYSFGFVANMLYMMQQIAPGPFKMTHYAFATALMNLVLVPTQTASGPLADALGYQSFFLFVMLASIPSIAAAWLAPFPRPHEDQSDEET